MDAGPSHALRGETKAKARGTSFLSETRLEIRKTSAGSTIQYEADTSTLKISISLYSSLSLIVFSCSLFFLVVRVFGASFFCVVRVDRDSPRTDQNRLRGKSAAEGNQPKEINKRKQQNTNQINNNNNRHDHNNRCCQHTQQRTTPHHTSEQLRSTHRSLG